MRGLGRLAVVGAGIADPTRPAQACSYDREISEVRLGWR
jgi:hypothetical protein